MMPDFTPDADALPSVSSIGLLDSLTRAIEERAKTAENLALGLRVLGRMIENAKLTEKETDGLSYLLSRLQ
jgi:hypothetical protein